MGNPENRRNKNRPIIDDRFDFCQWILIRRQIDAEHHHPIRKKKTRCTTHISYFRRVMLTFQHVEVGV